MSMEVSNFDPNEPGASKDSLYIHAYNSLLSGLILTDLVQIRQSADTLSESGFPLADELDMAARDMENSYLDGDDREYGWRVEEVAETTIQSYAYSGLPIDRGAILMAREFLGFSKYELRHILKPNNVLGLLATEGLSREERAELRYFGKKAMRELGVGSWVMKLTSLVNSGS